MSTLRERLRSWVTAKERDYYIGYSLTDYTANPNDRHLGRNQDFESLLAFINAELHAALCGKDHDTPAPVPPGRPGAAAGESPTAP